MFILFRKGNLMKKGLLVVSISFVLLNMSGMAQAKGDIDTGKVKSTSCAGCHGDDGNSAMPLFPKLADQNEEYLVKQLQAFKDGTRIDATMSAMVAGLSEQDMRDIAVFYEQQKASSNQLPPLDLDNEDEDEESDEGDMPAVTAETKAEQKQAAEEQQKALIALGYDVYRNGDLEREISACIACHGPHGEGNKPASVPALERQHADYLMKTLSDYKNGVRSNNPDNIMHMIAKKMTKEEIKGLSYYISIMK